METQEQKDEVLWRVAKRRAAFKKHLSTYIIINLFLWGIWFFTSGRNFGGSYIPWPAWVSLGWGVGIAADYVETYVTNKHDAIQREYEKLKNQHK